MKKNWFQPKHHSGWDNEDKQGIRRRTVLKNSKGNALLAGRRMQALANINKRQNPEIAHKARQDALFFFRLNRSRNKRS